MKQTLHLCGVHIVHGIRFYRMHRAEQESGILLSASNTRLYISGRKPNFEKITLKPSYVRIERETSNDIHLPGKHVLRRSCVEHARFTGWLRRPLTVTLGQVGGKKRPGFGRSHAAPSTGGTILIKFC